MSGIFGSGHKPVVNILGGIRVQTSLQGLPIPIVYGRTRIAGNLVWYGDFIAKKVTVGKKGGGGGGSGKKGGTEYDYGAAIILGLCQGPISRIGNIWSTQGNLPVNETSETYVVPGVGGSYTATQATTYLHDFGVTRGDAYSVVANDFGAPSSITLTGTQQTPMIPGSVSAGHYGRSGAVYTFSAADAGKTMTIRYTYAPPVTSGGTAQDPIVTVGFSFFNGALGQSTWSYLTSKHPAQAIPYSGLAHVATSEFDLGMGGTLPNLGFEIFGLLPFPGAAGDCNPSDVLYDLLTNAIYGCGIDASQIGSMTAYSNYCLANGLLISPALDTARTAADWIKDILEATNSEIIETGGKLVVIPYGDTTVIANGVTFTPATQPIYDLTADDFIRDGQSPAVQVERPTVQDAYNSVKVEFLDRGNGYNANVVESQDLQAIDAYKYRPAGTKQFHMFTTQAPAAKCAATILARLVYIRNKFKFRVSQKYIRLDPMDLVTITVPELGYAKQAVRILTIDEQADRTLQIEAEEFPWGCSGPTLYPRQAQIPGGPNAYAPPGSVNAPIMFEALSRLNDQIGHSVWFGLSGANAEWGGCRIWVSLDGVSYQQAATSIGQAKMGTLTSALASHADPDTSDTLSVDLTESSGILDSFTSLETDTFIPLCYVDGELIAYQNATLTGAFKFDLGTKLRRGVYGSAIGSHAIGSKFLFLDDTTEGWNYDVGLIGKTVHFKFTSFNRSGLIEENIADVTDYTFAITGASLGLLTPAHATYRPLSNPLTGHDAGASATVNIAAFSMRVAGMTDIAVSSGAIAGLSYNTLYFIYYDDPGFLGGAVTFQATTTKETALGAAGRFFVGSVTTPKSGAADTIGNNDGGAGSQIGFAATLYAGIISDANFSQWTNQANINDGNAGTFGQCNITGLINNLLFIEGFSGVAPAYGSIVLNVKSQVVAVGGTGGVAIKYSLDGGATFTTIYSVNAARGLTTDTVTLPATQNIGAIQVQVLITAPGASGTVTANVHEAWLSVSG